MVKKIKVLLLAAGKGSRLKPYTEFWPKCLMPINKHPLLEYWLLNLKSCGFEEVLINLHYKSEILDEFLSREQFKNFVKKTYEPKLLGTAGTIRANADYFSNSPSLIIHADNLISCDIHQFIQNHSKCKEFKCLISMMSFKTKKPKECGILDLDKNGIVKNMYEKVKNPPSDLANGAVYIFEKEVIKYIKDNKNINDISLDLLPNYMGKILTWHNKYVHLDIGSISELRSAQNKEIEIPKAFINDEWQRRFLKNKIHKMIND